MIVVIDLIGQPYLFIGTAIGLNISGVMGLNIGRVMGLAIGGAILMGADIAIGFFGLLL